MRNNESVAGEALSYLVGMLAAQKGPDKDNPYPRLKDAVPFYERFHEGLQLRRHSSLRLLCMECRP